MSPERLDLPGFFCKLPLLVERMDVLKLFWKPLLVLERLDVLKLPWEPLLQALSQKRRFSGLAQKVHFQLPEATDLNVSDKSDKRRRQGLQ